MPGARITWWRGREVLRQYEAQMVMNVSAACMDVIAYMNREMAKPKHGVIYRKKGRKVGGKRGRGIAGWERSGKGLRTDKGRLRSGLWQASRPDEYPAVSEGAFRRSITYQIRRRGLRIIGRIGSALAYARALELGTRHMAPRAPFRRAIKERRKRILRLLSLRRRVAA